MCSTSKMKISVFLVLKHLMKKWCEAAENYFWPCLFINFGSATECVASIVFFLWSTKWKRNWVTFEPYFRMVTVSHLIYLHATSRHTKHLGIAIISNIQRQSRQNVYTQSCIYVRHKGTPYKVCTHKLVCIYVNMQTNNYIVRSYADVFIVTLQQGKLIKQSISMY